MSLRAAINGECRDCIHDELAAGSAAVQVELCACYAGPLWPVRPVRPAGVRVPYSPPVVDEQRLSPAMAAFRLANPPFTRPPESLDMPESLESTAPTAEPGLGEAA